MNKAVRRTTRRGFWVPMKEAVAAMLPHDLLVWEVTLEDRKSAWARVDECRTSEFCLACNWLDGKLFIVRTR